MIDGGPVVRSALVAALVAGEALAQPAPAPAAGPAAGSIDVLGELSAIGKRALPRPAGDGGPTSTCVAPAEAERAEIQQRVLAWIDQQFPGELPDVDQGERALGFSPGCKQGRAVSLSVSQDRTFKKPVDTDRLRRNFVLRVEGGRIESIAARTSTASFDWMEWADEGGLAVYGLIDLDGDGTGDLVWSDFRHEGGSMSTSETLSVRFATGRIAPIATVQNLADLRVVQGQLVIAGRARHDARAVYGCVGKDLRVAPCAAAARLQRVADQVAAATALTELPEAPDRDLAVEWLDTLGVKAPPELLAALPATPAAQKAQRHVAKFLASKQLDGAFESVFEQPHPEAAAYLDRLASGLGDRPCTPAPLGAATRRKLDAWVARQDASPQWQIEIIPACGTYAWARWTSRSEHMTEALVGFDGPEPVQVAELEEEKVNEEVTGRNGVPDPGYGSSFFQHGATTVGFVIRNHDLLVIAQDKIVARRQGTFARFAYRRGWGEVSADLVIAGDAVLHATPAGLETVDRPAVKQRVALRAALERVVDGRYPSSAPDYLAALRTLGADGTLIAECQALAP